MVLKRIDHGENMLAPQRLGMNPPIVVPMNTPIQIAVFGVMRVYTVYLPIGNMLPKAHFGGYNGIYDPDSRKSEGMA